MNGRWKRAIKWYTNNENMPSMRSIFFFKCIKQYFGVENGSAAVCSGSSVAFFIVLMRAHTQTLHNDDTVGLTYLCYRHNKKKIQAAIYFATWIWTNYSNLACVFFLKILYRNWHQTNKLFDSLLSSHHSQIYAQ